MSERESDSKKTILLQAEKILWEAHEANEARKTGTVFGYETFANLSGPQVEALIEELRSLRLDEPAREPLKP